MKINLSGTRIKVTCSNNIFLEKFIFYIFIFLCLINAVFKFFNTKIDWFHAAIEFVLMLFFAKYKRDWCFPQWEFNVNVWF